MIDKNAAKISDFSKIFLVDIYIGGNTDDKLGYKPFWVETAKNSKVYYFYSGETPTGGQTSQIATQKKMIEVMGNRAIVTSPSHCGSNIKAIEYL